jgi:hypothetical protein
VRPEKQKPLRGAEALVLATAQPIRENSMRKRRVRTKIRPGLKAPTCLAFLAAVALALPALAQAALPQPIYFFTDTAQPINNRNPLVIRPSGFVMFQDGSWVLERLRWTGWGSSVARATGVSNSSNDIPNAAQGKRIKTWAHVTLSNPGRFQGHEVYRCFTMTVPSPASDMHLCLGHAHSIYILEPAKHPASKPATTALEFFAGKGIACGMNDGSGPVAEDGASCESRLVLSNGTEVFAQRAAVGLDGQIVTCAGSETACALGNPGISPTYSPGKVITVGAFTCKVLETGVECKVSVTGKGFLITPETVTKVGG